MFTLDRAAGPLENVPVVEIFCPPKDVFILAPLIKEAAPLIAVIIFVPANALIEGLG